MKEKYKKYLPILLGKYIQFLFIISRQKALRKSYTLFCTPRKGKILPEQEDFLENAVDEVVAVDNIEVQTYRWAGLGETILLVHGWESNSHRWKGLIQKLKKQDYNIIAFDAPAHGYSTGKILNIPLYSQCLQKIVELYRPNHIMGHSVGGMTTLFHQYIYPNQEIEKLVVLAPPSELARIMKGFQQTLRLSSKFMNTLSQYFKDKHGFYFDEFSISKFSQNISQKGLLIHDKNDDIAPYQESVAISNNWNGVQFVSTENYGHSLFFDEVDTMIIEFLRA
ncbi:alpha/beta hydrolase [Aquimarina algicola]|uniref:Alpha/beta hydrolase n=1 Tax=Aquimarina algicola TaxID=2589995 RepID=A0A504ITA2_9FLAO|nr:alpha/beta fold hydrolase [Aquimarina algicola]TPN81707.1 alpha/beta hydrolase [Aquimarina algicola]